MLQYWSAAYKKVVWFMIANYPTIMRADKTPRLQCHCQCCEGREKACSVVWAGPGQAEPSVVQRQPAGRAVLQL